MITAMPDNDVLVFRWDAGTFRLIGGTGRGEGWASIVDVPQAESPYMDEAWRSGRLVTVSAEPGARMHVAGPYWAERAVLVPVGHEHLVIFGNPEAAPRSDVAFVTAAARAVEQAGETSAEKLLADELELAHAVR